MNRREFIRRSSLSALTAWAGSSMLFTGCHTEEDMIGEPSWIVEGSFDRPLSIPPTAGTTTSLHANVSLGEIIEGRQSPTFSYGNGILGPTFYVNSGNDVSIQFQNNLKASSNIHWHGLILPADMDGHPKDVALPGGSLNYDLPIRQRAGTYWYHPHPHGFTARQVFMGLAGMFIVRDAEEAALNLPSGEFEVPLIIQDKRFNGAELDYSPTEDELMTGYLGEQVIVNGVHAPSLTVASTWYRFRILNGSTARVYNLALSNGKPLLIIGSDGGLLRTTEQTASILLGPGERLDVLIDFSGHSIGDEIYLVSNKFSKYDLQGRQAFKIIKFKIDRTSTQNFQPPVTLSTINSLSENFAIVRTFDISSMSDEGGHGSGMGKHAINGKIFEMDRIDASVEAGSTEVWQFDNRLGDEIHPMHIHGVQFQLLSRQGGRNTILPHEKGWKDTVLVMPGEQVRLIMTFPEYKGTFVLHCHNLEHEDDGMMLNYEII